MGGKTVILIIIIIIGLGVGLYLYSSGAFVKGVNGFNSLFPAPSSSVSHAAGGSTSTSGSFWSFLDLPGFNSSLTGPSIPPPQQQTTGSGPASGSTGSSGIGSSNPNLTAANVPTGFTLDQLSPYFHDIRLSGVSAGTSYYYGTITLSDDNYNSTDTIDITGWQIKSRDGGEYIPQAINIYDPTGLTPPSDIIVKQGDTVSLYSSSAPFNLRLNECIGYVAHVADFDPALPLSCPEVDQSQIQNFTGACQEYIDSIGGCEQPNMASPQIPQTDYACQDYLENNFTYKSCFQAHDGDANFLSNQVWVWTGANVVDQYHDSVELLDRNGLLVDLYTY